MTQESEIPKIPSDRRRPLSGLALFALGTSAVAAVITALGGFGVRWGMWGAPAGFAVVRSMLWVGLAAAGISVVALFAGRPGGPKRGFVPAFGALALALLVVGVSLELRRTEARLPPIHDISTDVNDPPPFVAIAPLRTDAHNNTTYAGDSIARIQEIVYGDVQPILLDLAHYDAYLHALRTAEESGWTIIDASERDGRIEATARTGWFGFQEDIIVRLTAVGSRTVVDVRSASRDRQADLGANAHRIRRYLDRLAR
jgi:hypothetical protein